MAIDRLARIANALKRARKPINARMYRCGNTHFEAKKKKIIFVQQSYSWINLQRQLRKEPLYNFAMVINVVTLSAILRAYISSLCYHTFHCNRRANFFISVNSNQRCYEIESASSITQLQPSLMPQCLWIYGKNWFLPPHIHPDAIINLERCQICWFCSKVP